MIKGKVPTAWLIADDLVAIDDDLVARRCKLRSVGIYEHGMPRRLAQLRLAIKRDALDAVTYHIDEIDEVQKIIEEVFAK